MFGMLPLNRGTPHPTAAQEILAVVFMASIPTPSQLINYEMPYNVRVWFCFNEFGWHKSIREQLDINITIKV